MRAEPAGVDSLLRKCTFEPGRSRSSLSLPLWSVMGSGSRNQYVRSSYKLMKQAKNPTPTYSTRLLPSEQDSGGIWKS